MKLVTTCPACGKQENHICQDELSENGLWLVDTYAIAGGAKPVDAPSHEEYRKSILVRASGLQRPTTVLTLVEHDGPQLVVGEASHRLRRAPLFLGLAVADTAGAVKWLYCYTGLHGLLCLTAGSSLRNVLLAEGALLPVLVRHDGTHDVLQPVSTNSVIEDELPDPGATLSPDELAALRVFVDHRIGALS